MNAVTWSPNLINLIQSLKQLSPTEIVAKLKDQSFIKSWSLSPVEVNAISSMFKSKSRNQNEEAGNWS